MGFLKRAKKRDILLFLTPGGPVVSQKKLSHLEFRLNNVWMKKRFLNQLGLRYDFFHTKTYKSSFTTAFSDDSETRQ